MVDMPEIEITVQDITEGTNFTRAIKIKSDNPNYDGKTIRYRALTGEEFASAMEKSGLSQDQNPSDSFKFLIEVGKIGVTTPGIGKIFGKLDKEIITEVGSAILGVSQIDEKKSREVVPES